MAALEMQATDAVVTGLVLALLIINVALLFRQVPLTKVSEMLDTLRSGVSKAFFFVEDLPISDEVRSLVAERSSKLRLDYAVLLGNFGLGVFAVAGLVLELSLLAGGGAASASSTLFNRVQATCFAGIFFIFTVSRCARMTSRRWNLCFFLVLVVQRIGISPLASPTRMEILRGDAAGTVLTFLFSLASFDLRIIDSWLLGFSFVDILLFAYASGDRVGLHMRDFTCSKGSAVFPLLLVAHLLLSGLRDSLRRHAEVRVQNCKNEAFKSLLSLLCDAVVELDHGLSMVEHLPPVAHIVGQDTAGISLKNRDLREFMPVNADKEAFQKSLSSCTSSSSPGSLTLSFAGLNGVQAAFQVIHISFLTPHGQLHHLVGLREDVGFHWPGEEVSVTRMANLASAPESICGMSAKLSTPPDNLSQELALALAPAMPLPAALESPTNEEFQVDFFLDETLTISWASAGLRTQLGSTGSLREVLHDASALRHWMLRRIQLVKNSGLTGPDSASCLEYGFLRSSKGRSPRKAFIFLPPVQHWPDGNLSEDWLAAYRASMRISTALESETGSFADRAEKEERGGQVTVLVDPSAPACSLLEHL